MTKAVALMKKGGVWLAGGVFGVAYFALLAAAALAGFLVIWATPVLSQ